MASSPDYQAWKRDYYCERILKVKDVRNSHG